MINDLLNIKDKKILIIGDSMLDHYIKVSSNRISSEYPGLIFDYIDDYYQLGGASNVANNISKFNVKIDLISVTGADMYSNTLKKMLKENNINDKYIISLSDYKTILKDRYYSEDYKQIMRVDTEINYISNYNIINEKINLAFKNNYDLIVISDYHKGIIIQNTFDKIIKLSLKKGVKIICDPKDDNINYHDLFILKPNKKEIIKLINSDIDNKKIIDYKIKNNIENIVLTLGEEGMILYDKNNKVNLINTKKREVFDVTGAGDTVLSYLAVTSIINIPLIESCNIANIAGGVKVNEFGTRPITLNNIYPYLCKNKLLERNILKSFCDIIHKDNKKIVFTNGCFDIIHTGHIHLLKEAKKLGDILILGLNSDLSTKKLKGNSRPVNIENDRIELLSTFDFIDYIVVFDEETPLELIKLIKPDILVKGSDYKDKYVVGTKEVLKYGGKLELISIVSGKSTTNIIKKINEGKNV